MGTLEDFGKHGRVGLARLQDHTVRSMDGANEYKEKQWLFEADLFNFQGAVTDIKWNWFNDNVLASGSADCSVKIWHVTDQLKVVLFHFFVYLYDLSFIVFHADAMCSHARTPLAPGRSSRVAHNCG